MSVTINASNSAGIQITSDTSGTIQFQSNGANTIAIAANGTVTNPSGTLVATSTGSVNGSLIRAPQILTSGTSYTTPTNCTAIYVEAVGGGGGGGGGDKAVGGAGGGGGAYCAKYFTVTGNTAYSYAIGAGGAASPNAVANGSTGSNTTFTVGGTTITATGGPGGTGNAVAAANATALVQSVNGDINGWPSIGFGYITSSQLGISVGGSSLFSSGFVVAGSKAGANGVGFGSGASGGTGLSNALGGTGANGAIRIWEFT